MPVIEQAKGILIAQMGCTPGEAFDMLRRASQRSKVRVAELAATIVDRAVTRRRPDPKQEQDPPGQVRGARLPG